MWIGCFCGLTLSMRAIRGHGLMKICKYCRTENSDFNANCTSCSGNEFFPKCNNCGSIVNTQFCANCGTKAGDKGKQCLSCGRVFFSSACPDCGWKPGGESPRQYYPIDSQATPMQFAYSQPQQSYKPPKKQMSLFAKILLWICFPYVMVFVALYQSDMKSSTKYLITLAVVLFILLYGRA